ncbi:MAG: DUF4244 domain-containing protein [Actinomycetota bacterium]|nr:DUF4244 domain-containing protein [Actinomycetota bacterium]
MSTRFAGGRLARLRGDAGLAVAEYAVATVAVCGLALVFYKLLTGPTIVDLLFKVIEKALTSLF